MPRKKIRDIPNTKCFQCGKEIYRQPSSMRDKNFCSNKCRGLYNEGKPLSQSHKNILSISAKKRVAEGRGNFFKKGHQVSERCREISRKISKSLVGEKGRNWRGGKVSKTLLERWSQKNKEFRKSIFLRDDFICQSCGKHGGYLHVHHLKEWAKFPELRFSEDNCITLCRECHYKIHFQQRTLDKP